MAAYSSSQSGPWSDPATWGGSGPPGDGDTASIGAHTVTLTANATVGTSPNDATTKVVDLTSASSILDCAGFILTVKGNIGGVNNCTDRVGPDGKIVFDASGSGGTPVYTWVNVGFGKHEWIGTEGHPATVEAVSGRTFAMQSALAASTFSWAVVRRCSSWSVSSISGAQTVADTVFDTCAIVSVASSSGTIGQTWDRVEFVNGTDAAESWRISHSAAYTSGTRRIRNCKVDKLFTYSGRGFLVEGNYFDGGVICTAAATVLNEWAWRHNYVSQDGSLLGGTGQRFPFSTHRNYWVIFNEAGNPHWMAPTALLGADNRVEQSVFEGNTPDAIDTGDAVIVGVSATSGGNKIVGRNCVLLPNSRTGVGAQLLTVYGNDTSVMEFERNTVCVNDSGLGKRAGFAFAEGSDGAADQIAVLRSNIAFGTSPGQGYFIERIQGTVDGHITEAGANYNHLSNCSLGNNGRGYQDHGNAPPQDLWTTGNADGNDAAAAGVDDDQTTGDADFVDPTRNLAAWAVARGYGSDFDDGKAALRAAPGRIPDLIDYVFDGFKTRNSTLRTSAHDGGCRGAANAEPGRSLGTLHGAMGAVGEAYGISTGLAAGTTLSLKAKDIVLGRLVCHPVQAREVLDILESGTATTLTAKAQRLLGASMPRHTWTAVVTAIEGGTGLSTSHRGAFIEACGHPVFGEELADAIDNLT